MTYERARDVSLALAEAHIPHTIQVAYAPDRAPGGETDFDGIIVRIDLLSPTRHAIPTNYPPDSLAAERGRRLSERLAELEKVADRFGLEVETSIMGEGLTLSERR